jgi:putative transposase
LAPISFRHTESSAALFIGEMPSGAMLLFANGLRAHVGSGTEDVLRELLEKKLMSHVLP